MLRNTSLEYIKDPKEASDIKDDLLRLPIVAVDIFFITFQEKNKPALLLAGTEKIHYVFDIRRCGIELLNDFFSSKSLKVMCSAYEKILSLYQNNVKKIENITDIIVLEQLITNNYFFPPETRELDDLSDKYLSFRVEKGKRILIDNLAGDINGQMLEFLRIELLVIYKIFMEQVKKIKAASLERVSRIESNLIKSLAKIQYNGIYFDIQSFIRLFSSASESNLIDENLPILNENEIAKLFRKRDSTSIHLQRILSEFADNYKDPAHILCQNANELIKRTGLPESRIHSHFIQISSVSGRSSSHSPNLFAIPKTRIFREYFSAPTGRVIITLDYSTFELGVLAALSRDPHFLKAFRQKIDLHSYVAELMFSKKVSKTENPELRRRAKAINFGIIYGMTAQGLAKRLQIEKMEATKLINTYYMVFPSLYSYIQNSINNALKTGELRTLAGRRCLINPLTTLPDSRKSVLNEILKKVGKDRGEIYGALLLKSLEEEYFKRGIPSEEMYTKRLINVINEGVSLNRALKEIDFKIQELYRFIRNMPVQGTAADIMKLAINMIDESLSEKGSSAFIVNIVHDEILIEVDKEDAAEIAKTCREIMIDASRQILKEIAIEVDCNIGLFWGDSSLNHLQTVSKEE